MKKKIKKLHRSNKGFSLMELLVTILVSAIVTAAVAGFLSMGLNYYRRTNAETALQVESQVAELFLTELLQESENYSYYVGADCPAGVSNALEVLRDGNRYVVAKKGELLVYGMVDNPSEPNVTARIQNVTDKGIDEVFLARYVTEFKVEKATLLESIDDQNGLVKLTMKFETDGKIYTGTQTVLLRNTVKN